MFGKILLSSLTVLGTIVGLTPMANAADAAQGITRNLLVREALSHKSDHSLSAVIVHLDPDASASPHKHDGFVFVYVLEGDVRSQLDDNPPVEYTTGDSWVEPIGVTHSLTQNLSHSRAVKLLAVFIAQDGASLTSTDAIPQ